MDVNLKEYTSPFLMGRKIQKELVLLLIYEAMKLRKGILFWRNNADIVI